MIKELEEDEEVRMRPVIERLEHERAGLRGELSHLRTQNTSLLTLAARYDDLLSRAKSQLATLESEHKVLCDELERALH